MLKNEINFQSLLNFNDANTATDQLISLLNKAIQENSTMVNTPNKKRLTNHGSIEFYVLRSGGSSASTVGARSVARSVSVAHSHAMLVPPPSRASPATRVYLTHNAARCALALR
ncbi:unnamed protein product [Arctia plantaginis]|uniref:Uncharacterized protein n=1 Tax=Arctia plantaginis TaxID=874455 RepID=A0A8S1B9X3_ARCPL|nr:unnamed protein product [Arctia plantaginis]